MEDTAEIELVIRMISIKSYRVQEKGRIGRKKIPGSIFPLYYTSKEDAQHAIGEFSKGTPNIGKMPGITPDIHDHRKDMKHTGSRAEKRKQSFCEGQERLNNAKIVVDEQRLD